MNTHTGNLVKSILIAGLIIFSGTAVVLVSYVNNTDVRSRAASNDLYGPSNDACEQAFQAGSNLAGCETYIRNRKANCYSAFADSGFVMEGCGSYIQSFKNDCRQGALAGRIYDGCGPYLKQNPITAKERLCAKIPNSLFCTVKVTPKPTTAPKPRRR